MVVREKNKNVLISFFGHIFEHFESSIFTFSGVFVASYFFSKQDSWMGQYGVYIAISSGFIMGPFGALIFSWIGDKFGRKPALVSAYVIGVIPSLLIPLLPSYASIGIFSSLILIFCRLVQGIGSGGAFAGRIVFLAELHPALRNINLGILLSLGFVGALLGTSLSSYFMDMPDLSWGWKIPYLLASLMGVVLLLVRKHIIETPPWEAEGKSDAKIPLISCLKEYPWEMVAILCFGMALLMPFYLGVSWMGGYVQQAFGLPASEILRTLSFLMITAGISVVFFFWIATYISRFKMLIVGMIIAFLTGVLLFIALKDHDLFYITILQFVIAIQVGVVCAPIFLYSQDFFPVKYRYSGFSVPFAIGQALMTGTTPLFAQIITEQTLESAYVTIMIFISGLLLGISALIIKRKSHPA